MNYTQTCEILIAAGVPADRLPVAWQVGINLSEANLRGANLSGAGLSGADLRGADLNWQSHDLIAEIIRRAAGDNVQRRMLAGLILISRDWCWEKFLSADIESALREWGLGVMRGYIRDGDDAPEILRQAVES
jgi:hypothetical protein